MQRDYTWVKPIRFSEPTKEWLMKTEWPPSLAADLDQVAKHNDKCKALGIP